MRTTRAQVNGEARYATIQLTLQTPQSAAVVPVPSRWDDAVGRAGEILVAEATIVLYALVVVANGVVSVSKEACANPTGFVYGDFVTEIPAYFCSRGRNGFKGRVIEPEQVRLMVLPPSLQT